MKRKNKAGNIILRIHTLTQVGILMVLLGSCTDMGDEILSEEIAGCTDTEACNFNAEATTDDGSCLFNDCAGDCGGEAVIDSCGICGGNETDSENCGCADGSEQDCAGYCLGEIGFGAEVDSCGICEGDNSTCTGCTDENAVNYDPNAIIPCEGCCVTVSFISDIQPIFNVNCMGCHGNSSGLNLSTYSNLMNGGNSGSAVIPGDGANSLIIQKLRGTGPGSQMPLGGNALDESLISLIETWINEGALNN
ncbi:MAG: c-type cytochrome domain-containing protein [Candidatus Marinimicrobia bacterium]|nr:c-type cytochrome domain-containing protein [Candidatus Neomarinimicrobiota bacterium]